MKKKATPKEVVNFLNEILKTDSRAIETLFNTRVFCNKKLANHPTVQVGQFGKKPHEKYFVGFIGILNGLFGIDKKGWGCISMDLTRGNRIKQFRVLK